MWFDNCKTITEVDQLYRALAKENHPDRGGDTETMADINTEYQQIVIRLSKIKEETQEETPPESRKKKIRKETADNLKKAGTSFFTSMMNAGFEVIFDKYFEEK